MAAHSQTCTPAEAARRLGVSAKALRLYEERGLVTPERTAAGYRAYGPDALRRAGEVAALRALGFSLAQVTRILAGDPRGLEAALAAHEARLGAEIGRLGGLRGSVKALRDGLGQGHAPSVGDLAALTSTPAAPIVAFDLPWPWGGERFELRVMRRLNFIIGPLGSGKTRLAMALAEHLPGAAFLGLDRLEGDPAQETCGTEAILAWLTEEGATPSPALTALAANLDAEATGPLVIDMVELGLDAATQAAVAAYLRAHHPAERPLFMLTRSSAILDLEALTPDTAIILCPANHSPPVQVDPYPGAPGFESVATCLATPEVRARTAGLKAVCEPVAS